MTKSYLLYKCGGSGRKPLLFFSADSATEAREAPTWLRRKHPDKQDLHLEPGEFFEILEKDQCPPEEWEQAARVIGTESATVKAG